MSPKTSSVKRSTDNPVGGKLNVYNLGALGVNLVSGHIHMKDGELLQCQNAMASPVGAQVALVKRPGMDRKSSAGGYVWNMKSFLQKSYTERGEADGISWAGNDAYASTLGRVVAVGGDSSGRVNTSDDGGRTWTPNNGQASAIDWVSVTWAPALGLFVAVANGSIGGTPKVMVSPDGFTWTIKNFATADGDWSSVAWSPTLGLLVAVSETGTVPTPLNTSPDGTTWTARVGVLGSWRRVIWAPTPALFLAMGYTEPSAPFTGKAHFMTSVNGTGWVDRATTVKMIVNDAVYVDALGLFVAVGNQADPVQLQNVATSTDGTTWTGRTAIGGRDLFCVEYASSLGLLVACSSNSYVFSANGIDWWEAVGTDLGPTRGSEIVWVSSLERFAVAGGAGAGSLSLE